MNNFFQGKEAERVQFGIKTSCLHLGNRTVTSGRHSSTGMLQREFLLTEEICSKYLTCSLTVSCVCVCGGGCCCCCLHRDFFAVFSKCWPNLDLAMNFCLSLNIKNNFYYRKFQTYIEVDRIIWVLMPFLFYISFPTFFLTWNILKKTPATC